MEIIVPQYGGPGPSPGHEKGSWVSVIASRIAVGNMIYYLDINDRFFAEDGTLARELFPDGVTLALKVSRYGQKP